jgi:hypothetical protein
MSPAKTDETAQPSSSSSSSNREIEDDDEDEDDPDYRCGVCQLAGV